MRPDRSKVIQLFDKNDLPDFSAVRMKPQKKKDKKTATQRNKERFHKLLEDERYSEFTEKDWYQYFVMRFEEQGKRFVQVNHAKDYAIIKSVINNLSWEDLKSMIDFVFDSGQDIIDTRTVGIWIMSKGWLQTIYQNTLLWLEGDYKTKNAPKRNREWVAEASEKTDKPKKKTKLRLKSKAEPEQEEEEVKAPKKKEPAKKGLRLRL